MVSIFPFSDYSETPVKVGDIELWGPYISMVEEDGYYIVTIIQSDTGTQTTIKFNLVPDVGRVIADPANCLFTDLEVTTHPLQ